MIDARRVIIKPEKARKLDLGCGDIKTVEYTGMDITDHGQEIVWDVRDGIPLPDGSLEEVRMWHVIEHLRNEDVDGVMREIRRVLKVGGKLVIRCPHATVIEAYYADHKTLWNEARIEGLVKGYQGIWEIEENVKKDIELSAKLIRRL